VTQLQATLQELSPTLQKTDLSYPASKFWWRVAPAPFGGNM
jgi:hypothetical protein